MCDTNSGSAFCRVGNELGNGYFIADGNTLPYSYYPYEPSIAGNVVLAVIFGLSTGLHFWQMIRKKAWYMAPLAVGANMEMLGYIGRFLNARQDPVGWTKMGYYLQEFTILLAPALYAITLILIFKLCVITSDGDSRLPVNSNIFVIVTVILAVVSLITAGAGAGLLVGANTPDDVETARKIMLGGVALLLVSVNILMLMGGFWAWKMIKNPTSRSLSIPPQVMWQRLTYVTLFCAMLLLVRCGFRSALFLQLKNHGFLAKKEAYFLAAEGGMMIQVSVILNWFHPTRIVDMDLLYGLSGSRSGDTYSHDTELGNHPSSSINHQVPKHN